MSSLSSVEALQKSAAGVWDVSLKPGREPPARLDIDTPCESMTAEEDVSKLSKLLSDDNYHTRRHDPLDGLHEVELIFNRLCSFLKFNPNSPHSYIKCRVLVIPHFLSLRAKTRVMHREHFKYSGLDSHQKKKKRPKMTKIQDVCAPEELSGADKRGEWFIFSESNKSRLRCATAGRYLEAMTAGSK